MNAPQDKPVRVDPARADYAAGLSAVDDAELVRIAEQQIWLSAFANNNPRAPSHWKADAAYTETARREKPWLYQHAWNLAYRSCGYEPSASDMKAALPSEPQP